ncbi:hypothetical protein [Sphingomonas flavalba]|uniref:hypothetical protein n=1 Tax=Sphingomonas flavalba TaxID=2559804 RepID=UPI00109D81F3|nr:hypothetical protein [Sphingomonas flavalba]
MDINELLAREQVSLMCAANARHGAARDAHLGLAELYAGRVRKLAGRLKAANKVAAGCTPLTREHIALFVPGSRDGYGRA